MLSIRKYAESRNISHVAVLKAIKTGRLSKSVGYDSAGKPKIADAALADTEWAANTDQSKPLNRVSGEPKRRKDRSAEAHAPVSAPIGDAAPLARPAAEAPEPTGPSYAKSRAIREAYQARMAKLDYEARAEKLLPADTVRVTMFNVARKARDMLMAMPDRIAPLIVGNPDAHEVHRLLTDEVRRVCAEIAGAKPPEHAQG
ncbi:hypothetical protein PQH03_06915 [Ralstonia insidiosa]|uniref:hypothetical protein n=1 Tax=Ralstonia insidiosa TaxID=190721 RepID=UPI00206F379D|nr:hypothetical protein [Ralstonia insidiosa]MDE4924356.1 hypothetical protein [Ralstonia insidiosa]UNJ99899.1 hypothetical protein MMB19_14350 [Ralstonia insidiosa]